MLVILDIPAVVDLRAQGVFPSCSSSVTSKHNIFVGLLTHAFALRLFCFPVSSIPSKFKSLFPTHLEIILVTLTISGELFSLFDQLKYVDRGHGIFQSCRQCIRVQIIDLFVK